MPNSRIYLGLIHVPGGEKTALVLCCSLVSQIIKSFTNFLVRKLNIFDAFDFMFYVETNLLWYKKSSNYSRINKSMVNFKIES